MRAWADAPAEAVWPLLATPAAWPRWSPQIVGVTAAPGGDNPGRTLERAGGRYVVHGPGPVHVPVEITRVDPGERWDFRARLPGLWDLESAHVVHPAPPDAPSFGTRISVQMVLRGPLGGLLDRTALLPYVPLAHLAVRTLARRAAQESRSAPSRSSRPPVTNP